MELEQYSYDNKIVKQFAIASLVFGAVGMLVGLLIASQLFAPALNFNLPYTSFGRIRPLHTNAIIFAFVGIFLALKQRRESLLQVSAWILLGVLLVYFPFNLQRRFMTGLYIPVAVLSVSGVLWLVNRPNPALKRQLALGVPALIGLSVVTNLLILISVFAAVLSKQPNPKIYIPEADIRAMLWMH